ncbi:MAG: aspartate/glutamate racemase family protein [Bacillota bacterium]|nr:aspartate/glutamate racemase family protein [Bacillota bacterium]HPF17995.1 aspartate/glutamate racemase family protein [Bacillota bacterium]
MKLGVIAGTRTDTQLGVRYVETQGHEALGRPCSENPTQQLDMQLHHKKELADRVVALAAEMLAEGAEGIYIYCNSLSTAIDLDNVKKRIPAPVATPLDVYAECAGLYKHIFVIAANCQSLAGIERVIKKQNPGSWLSGAALQALVYQIEDLLPPEEIVSDLHMREFLRCFTAMKAEVLILGCTHFPYIHEQIRDAVSVPIIDPGKRMLELLARDLNPGSPAAPPTD